MSRVLLLNLDYEPLNICELSRAMKLLIVGKADILHGDDSNLIYSGGRQRGELSAPFTLAFYDDVVAKCQMTVKKYSSPFLTAFSAAHRPGAFI